jgi:hypothetical protein
MKKKYSFLILILLFSFLLTIFNYDIIAEEENRSDNFFRETDNIAPIITLDCSKKYDDIFLGTIHDVDNYLLSAVAVNLVPDPYYISYVNDSASNFAVTTDTRFTDFYNGTHNRIDIVAVGFNSSPSPLNNFEDISYGPGIGITCLFCDNQNCWGSGGGGGNSGGKNVGLSSSFTLPDYINDTAPYIEFFFEDYVTPNPEIKYNTTEPVDHIETEDHVKKKEAYYIRVTNDEGFVSYVKLIGLMSNTEVKPVGAEIPFNFEAAIIGIIVSTVAIVLIRRRKNK